MRYARGMRGLLLICAMWLVASVALADILPDPGRPDFDDTPLPMPDEPQAWEWGLIALTGAGALMLRRRRAC